MSQSIFERKPVNEILREIQNVYLSDNRPWIIGYSGGKDSTCLVQLVWNALKQLPKEKLTKDVYVISSDTLVEAPQIAKRITSSLKKIKESAVRDKLRISTNLLEPPITDTFWVRLLGLGYPAPTSMFRWCTDLLKISNADRFITESVSKHGEVIVLLGMRKSESGTREQRMNLLKIENTLLSHHSKYAQTYVYTPLEDFSSQDVWDYLEENENPWGDNNADLKAMYIGSNISECPLVIDSSTPSCGGGRFGCWTCTVVDEQSYLSAQSITDENYEMMNILKDLREELKKTQDEFTFTCKSCKIKTGHNIQELFKRDTSNKDNRDKTTLCPIVVDSDKGPCNNKLLDYTTITIDGKNFSPQISDEEKTIHHIMYRCNECDSFLSNKIDDAVSKFQNHKEEQASKNRECGNKIVRYEVVDENLSVQNNWMEYREKVRRDGHITIRTYGDGYTPGPYKMDFRQRFLRKLFEGQKRIEEINERKNDKEKIELIRDEEIHEIQRIWRMEQGDWKNSLYKIYSEVMGKSIEHNSNELSYFTETEEKILREICDDPKKYIVKTREFLELDKEEQKEKLEKITNVPFKLLSNLLSLEQKYQNLKTHSKIYDKIKTELSKEWRDLENEDVFKQIQHDKTRDKVIKQNAPSMERGRKNVDS